MLPSEPNFGQNNFGQYQVWPDFVFKVGRGGGRGGGRREGGGLGVRAGPGSGACPGRVGPGGGPGGGAVRVGSPEGVWRRDGGPGGVGAPPPQKGDDYT